ncbi:MAG TPA: alpha/beta fold hydrolase [Kofleriaceae bacterium]|nr:alpha/beta fold hydrolase [Kofleriaceae bacterium]
MKRIAVVLSALLFVGCAVDDTTSNVESNLAPGTIAVVLAHGLDGAESSFDPSVVAAIEANGHVVRRTVVPGIESVANRAAALAPQIDEFLAETGAGQVHIIAHSMGGLDARYLIDELGYAPKVASLTTISSPHRGSPLADVALGIVRSPFVSQADALDVILRMTKNTDRAALGRALFDLSVHNAVAFNATVTDVPGVRYFSYAGFSTPFRIPNRKADALCGPAVSPGGTQPLLTVVQPLVANGFARIPNDGVVSIPSAQWGTFAGCIAADHLSQLGPAVSTHEAPAFFADVVAELALP